MVSRTYGACIRGDVPVDAAGVVARLVQPGLAQVRAVAGHEPAIVALQEPVELARDRELEPAQYFVGRGADGHVVGVVGVTGEGCVTGTGGATGADGAIKSAGAAESCEGAMRGAGTVDNTRARM